MNKIAFAFAALVTASALPALAQSRDTGSMGYPAPAPQGNVGTTAVPSNSGGNGSMAYPAPSRQGTLGTTTTGGNPNSGNTGAAQYPAPAPQGNVGTTTVR